MSSENIPKPPTDPDDPLLDPDLALIFRIFTEMGFTCHQEMKSPYHFVVRSGDKQVCQCFAALDRSQVTLYRPESPRNYGRRPPAVIDINLADPRSMDRIKVLVKSWHKL